MLRAFLDFIGRHPAATLCSWSGTRFDERALRTALTRWYPEALAEWERAPKIDLLIMLRSRVVLPPKLRWSLESFAGWCGFRVPPHRKSALDGFGVGLAYERFRKWGEPLPLDQINRRNSTDLRALAHVANWLRSQDWVLPLA